MKRAAGACLLPLLLVACDGDKLEIRQAVRSPDRHLIAVSSVLLVDAPMSSDDTRVKIFRVRDGKLIEPCQPYRGEYGAVTNLRWTGDERLDFDYQAGRLAEITTSCFFEGSAADRSVTVVPHAVFAQAR